MKIKDVENAYRQRSWIMIELGDKRMTAGLIVDNPREYHGGYEVFSAFRKRHKVPLVHVRGFVEFRRKPQTEHIEDMLVSCEKIGICAYTEHNKEELINDKGRKNRNRA